MNPSEKLLKKLIVKNSQTRVFFIFLVLIVVFTLSILTRFYAIEHIQIKDNSMAPEIKNNERLWICKTPWCKNQIHPNDIVLAQKRIGEVLLRRVIGLPGSELKISSEGHVKSAYLDFVWKNETAFIDSRHFYIPKKGDTLFLDSLNDVEMDLAISILKQQNTSFFIKPSVFQGSQELPLNVVGSARIASRPVSIKEIQGLPWQELFLIGLQVQKNQPSVGEVKIKREVYSLKDSSKIESFIVLEDYYYLACNQGARCIDSRELGLFSRSTIIGKKIRLPWN